MQFNSRLVAPLTPIAAAILALATPAVRAAGIVPDGQTATSVAIAPNGKALVTIAPPIAGVSHNTFTDFSVGKSGADLNNVGMNARTIVNEVTGTNPSLIEGTVTVVGPRANVIVANPNGITVNGGSFVNTGTLALSTGKVSFYDFQPAPGFSQRNVILDTSMGQIEIGPGGLTGAFNSLELIAKTLKIAGRVENTFTNSNGAIRAVVGDSHAEFDTSISPTDGSSQFVAYSAPASNSAGAIAIDITPLGSLVAGKITLIVTDQGAGVRHGGNALANAGDFVLSATGTLEITGGTIGAERDILIDAPKTVAVSREDSATELVAGRNIELLSSEVTLAAGRVQAGRDDQRGDITFGRFGLDAPGTMSFAGVESAQGYAPLAVIATGGIGIFGGGREVSINGTKLMAQQNVVVESRSISLATQVDNATTPAAAQASIASVLGGVSLIATDGIASEGGLVDGAAGVLIKAQNLVLKSASFGTEVGKSRITSSGGSIDIQVSGDTGLHASDIVAAGNVNIVAANITLENVGSGVGSGIAAVDGAVTIHATGDLINRGSLIQGSRRDSANAASEGAVTVKVGRDFRNESPDEKTLAAVFGAADDVSIRVQGNVVNHAARIVSNRNLTIDAQGDVVNIVDKEVGANGEQRVDYHTSGTELLVFTRSRSGFDIDYGKLSMPGQLAYLVADGDMSVKGRNITNRGGEIYSNNGSIAFVAEDKFVNEALASGQVHFERKCLIVCRTHAASDVTVTGGLISASNNLTIDAGIEAANIGGRVLALNDMTISAPKVVATGITGYSVLSRDQGMKSWFGDTWAQIYASDVGGSFAASRGKLTINGTLYEDRGTINGGAGAQVNGETIVIRPAHSDPVLISNHLGLPSWLGN